MTDTIYNDLKEQGLLLSEPVEVKMPPIRPPKPTLLGQIGSMLGSEFKLGEGPFPLIIIPVLSSAVIVARANTLISYKYELDKETGNPVVQEPKVENLWSSILAIYLPDNHFLNDRGEVPFIVEHRDEIVLYFIDLKESKILCKNSMKFTNTFSIRFVCEKEIIVMSSDLHLHHLAIQGGKLKVKNNRIEARFPGSPVGDQFIKSCKIVGNIDQEQDSVIAVFFLIKRIKHNYPDTEKMSREERNDVELKKERENNFEVLKVKEYTRTFEGKLQPLSEEYVVLQNNASCVLPENLEIAYIQNFYCVQTKFEILILKKKFEKYLFIDNVMQKMNTYNLKLNHGGLVTSYGDTSMEISLIQFADPKCSSKLLDTIEMIPGRMETFKVMWPFKNQKDTCLMMMFEKERKLVFYNLIKTEPMKKMLNVVNKISDKKKISIQQEIAVNLGINKREFYLNLWTSSKREIPDIYQYLLHCGDVTAIKKEIRLTLRRKKIIVPQFVKILERITFIIKQELKENLSQHMLKEYIKNDFLLRKIKLKQKDRYLDHRDLQKVYDSSIINIFVEIVKNDLYPEKKKLDPLHLGVEQPEKEVIDIGHVFQEFRVVILENYKQFIVDFLSSFQSHQLVEVIQNYYFLLPIYPFELKMHIHEEEYMTEVELYQYIMKANGQKTWFANMTSIEFNRELSKERIEKELHEYFPTSKITDAINTLVHSNYGATERLRKHGLISCSLNEYSAKLKEIYQVKLFLKVCEFANEKNPYSEEDISSQLVEIFKKENNLSGQAYETVRLYSSMHKFMLKNGFCEKKERSFTTEELIAFTPEDLVALFFLENRQRKEYIFNEFRDLYVNLYENPIKFNQVVEQFINSQNCSRIELEILVKEVLNKGQQFQIDNQELIELLIDGFCKKLEIREDTDTKHFLELMEEIQLSKSLGMKLNKIMQIRKCLNILNIFNCEKLTYFDMLDLQRDNEIFKLLLDRYFSQEIKKDAVRIEDEEITLDFCRNMLTVLLYIQETIYYDVEQKELLLTYGEILIEWKQFEVIKGILYDEGILEKLNIDMNSYIEELVEKALNTIYTDEEIIFDEETKKQIQEILDIYQTDNTRKYQEIAKLKLVEIFQSWQVTVHPIDVFSIVVEWNINNGREEFINNLYDEYLPKLNLKTIQAIYTYLEYTAERDVREDETPFEVNINNSQYVGFVLNFAQRLLKDERYKEIVEIFAFVKQMSNTEIDYELMTEAFLKSVFLLYPDEASLEKGKELIEYFTQNSNEDTILQQLFETNFETGIFCEGKIEREEKVQVDSRTVFKKHKAVVSLDLLWKIVTDEARERENTKNRQIMRQQSKSSEELKKSPSKEEVTSRSATEELYYAYYFIIVSLRNPRDGLTKLDRISYNFEILSNILLKLESTIDDNASLWAINTIYIFKKFISGLLFIGLARVKASENLDYHFSSKEEDLDRVKNFLKEDKSKYKDILDIIAKIEVFTNAAKAQKKNEKEIRYQKSKLKEEKHVEVEVEAEPEEEVNNVTLNLRAMREAKFEFTNQSHEFITEKDVLQRIYNRAFEEKQQKNRNKVRKEGNALFLTGLNLQKKDVRHQEILEKLDNQDLDKVKQEYSKDEIAQTIRIAYDEESKNFHEVVNLLDQLGVGDAKKIEVGRLCKVYQSDIPTQDLQKIFPFGFFLEGQRYTESQLGDICYNAIRANIQTLIFEKNNEYVRTLANFIGSIMIANKYIDLVYVDTLVTISQKYPFNSQSIIRFRILIQILGQYPEIIKENVSRTLQASKENDEMKKFVRQELELSMSNHYPEEKDLLDYIKKFN